jgi:hypothetical protein
VIVLATVVDLVVVAVVLAGDYVLAPCVPRAATGRSHTSPGTTRT